MMVKQAVFQLLITKAFQYNLLFEFSNRPNTVQNQSLTIYNSNNRFLFGFFFKKDKMHYVDQNWYSHVLDINDPDAIDNLFKNI